MAILLKTASVRVSSIQIIQVRVQNKGKSVWKSRYDRDVSELQGRVLSARRRDDGVDEAIDTGLRLSTAMI